MQNSRDSSVWRTLAVAFGDGLAFGVGVTLTRSAARLAANRSATIKRRTGRGSRNASARHRARKASSHGANPGGASRAMMGATVSAIRLGSGRRESRVHRRKRAPMASRQPP